MQEAYRAPIPAVSLQVSSWAVKDGRCYYRNRYVRTDAFVAEQEAGRMLFKGAFSRGDPAGCPSSLMHSSFLC